MELDAIERTQSRTLVIARAPKTLEDFLLINAIWNVTYKNKLPFIKEKFKQLSNEVEAEAYI